MVLLTTMAQSSSSSMSWLGLDKPVDHLVWSSTAGVWSSGRLRDDEPPHTSSSSMTSTTATSSTASTPFSVDSVTDVELLGDKIHCYVYKVNTDVSNWHSDRVGASLPLTKEHTRLVCASLSTEFPDVAEVYSPPRVTKRAKAHGLRPGWALDLSTGWDFSKRAHRLQALRLIKDTRPLVIILSPPCCVFSPLRNLTNYKCDLATVRQEEREGRLHLDFAVSLALLQMRSGRGFVFEHPKGASSWRTTSLQKLSQDKSVFSMQLDMCAFGLRGDTGLRRKPTLILTNIETLVQTLSKRCSQQHAHQPIEGGAVSRASAQCTDAFVDAILKGICKHIHFEALNVPELDDSWSRPQGDLCCRQFRPRPHPPLPKDCSFDLSKITFTGKRVMTKNFVNGITKVVEDDFRQPTAPASATSLDAVPWTGATWFETAKTVMLPQHFCDLATWLTRSLAHVLYDFQREQATFTVQSTCSSFPRAKFWGERFDVGGLLLPPLQRLRQLWKRCRKRKSAQTTTTPSTAPTIWTSMSRKAEKMRLKLDKSFANFLWKSQRSPRWRQSCVESFTEFIATWTSGQPVLLPSPQACWRQV